MYLKEFQKEFNQLLESHLNQKIESLLPYCDDNILKWIVEYIIPYQRWGKRFRPFLVKTLYDAFEWNWEEIMQLSMSYEILHLFALVHDDIQDQWDVRHWKPTFHKYIETLYSWNVHKWISQWILVWDWLLTRAFENFTLKTNNKIAMKYFFEMMHEVCMWQVIDIHLSWIAPDATPEQIQNKDKLKSWYYSFMRPMVLWAILANQSEEILEKTKKLWETMGLAFQMRDDLLDITWTDGHDNKTRFSDLSEWNQTIVLHEALQRVSKEDKSIILSYRCKEISPEDITKISQIIEASWALEVTKEKVNCLLDDSQSILDELIDTSKKEYTALSEIIEYLRV